MNTTPNKYLTLIALTVLLSLHFFASNRAEAQSTDYNRAGTWQNVTISQSTSTFSISGDVYGSAVFEGVNCPISPNEYSSASFGQMTYKIYNSSGTQVSQGFVLVGLTQSGNSCASQNNFIASIHNFSLDANISSLPDGNYAIMLETSEQSTASGVPAGILTYSANFTKTTQSSCSISSFTCSSSSNLSWVTTDCTSRNITPNIGNVPASGSTGANPGTTYTLTASGPINTVTSTASCPLGTPTLQARWPDGSVSQTIYITEEEKARGWIDVPFNYDNVGQVGSCVNNIECIPSPTGGATDARADCPVTTICK